MQRMTVPAGHNQTTRCYKRSTSEAFLCNAEEAQAFHYFPKKKKHPGRWLAAVLLTMICIALFGCAKPAPQPMPVGQDRAIPKDACANGDVGIWIDATTITCHKEIK